MRKALRDKRIATFVFMCALIFAVLFTGIAVMCLKDASYLFMMVFAILSAICYYIFIIYVFRFLDARTATELIDIMECYGMGSGPMEITELSEAMGWHYRFTRRFISACRRRGYFY